MSHECAASVAESPLSHVKLQSGRQIEEARKKLGLTQRQLARELGMGERWLREIESGNPKSTLDDHLICAYRLGLSTGHILIPLLFAGQRMSYPLQLAAGDLCDLERLCIEVIAERKLNQLTRALTPIWHGPTLAIGPA
ncbi:helix-turn-helix domain-containing protein [Sphingobium sp. H39-3-25]|uniref:helix-turn-helix domain-containing protein n=1 Tax=Sphingomonadales TaxID=204457 RepID=UPI0009FF2B06|nr:MULTISPECIES: helix-turn-helix domain-containing protein [Sphingomonadaceae]MDF0491129.1 helix-turn-helix domain-containing protein [Sphingomonas pollutisoli]MDF0545139.1 helix-turn-helix domain-containing protein [Sphingobium arseniciresistens]